jgi:hypothetical protein
MTASRSVSSRAALGESTTKSITMQRRDRPWVDTYVTILCGPFAMPPVDVIRDAVAAVGDRHEHSRLAWGFDDAKRRWLTPRPMESVVVERDWDERLDYGRIVDGVAADESLEPPLTFVRFPDHFAMKMSHSLGDGLMFVTVVAAVMLAAATGDVVPWPTKPAGRLPLLRAGLRTFGRNPALVRAALKDRPPPIAVETASRTRPWQPSRHSVHAYLPPDKSGEVYSWAAEHASGASRFAVQTALLMAGLRRVGMELSDDIRVMVDLRSYLGAGLIDGNFFAGVPMQLHWNMTPEQIAQTVKATKASGRPLAKQMVTSLRVGSAIPPRTVVEEDALPQVTFSYVGAPPQIDMLPYLPGHEPVYASRVEPGGPNGLTFLQGHCRGGMLLTACFHDNVIDAELVTAAMALVGSDPIGLLSEQGRIR